MPSPKPPQKLKVIRIHTHIGVPANGSVYTGVDSERQKCEMRLLRVGVLIKGGTQFQDTLVPFGNIVSITLENPDFQKKE